MTSTAAATLVTGVMPTSVLLATAAMKDTGMTGSALMNAGGETTMFTIVAMAAVSGTIGEDTMAMTGINNTDYLSLYKRVNFQQ
jgi:hypothetical protein